MTADMIRAHINPPDRAFENAVVDLSELFRLKKVTIFTGAGVSIPSRLPESKQLVESIAEILVSAVNELGLDTLELGTVIKEYRLEPILNAIVQFHGNQGLSFLSLLQLAQPNYNHSAIAQLAKYGYLGNIITLNFDVLFEIALQKLGVPFTWQLPLASVLEASKDPPSMVTITKPHGTLPLDGFTYQDYYLAATLRYAGDHPQEENIKVFNSISEQSPVLLVSGYRNDDWDIFPILKSVPWKRIYWVQYSNEPKEAVLHWLSVRAQDTSCLLYGDPIGLLERILNKLAIRDNEPDVPDTPTRNPDFSNLLRNPVATALAAVSLLDGRKNELYTSMLAQFGRLDGVRRDKRLFDLWERAMAWSLHAHKGNPRMAIRRYQKVISISTQSDDNDTSRLEDCLSMYYEHISTLKRPYLNPLLLKDIYYAHKWRKELQHRVDKIRSSKSGNPWIKKESLRILALTKFYRLDLYHNWGYHLLPFANRLSRRFIRLVFGRIAAHYDKLAEKHPNIDWEYHFVRRMEAHLLACNPVSNFMKHRLEEICDMFHQTSQFGHHAYTRSVLAIVQSDYEALINEEELMTDRQGVATPSGMLRMSLLQRYFWPDKVSLWTTLQSLFRHSRAKKES